jgi:acyl-homoserine-lactone acylase
MPRFIPRALSAVLAVAAAAGVIDAHAQAKYTAEVRRTSFGIVHVKANDFGSAGYGVGYAFAQDNFCMMADQFVTVRSERSRYFGPTAKTAEQVTNIASDFAFAYYNGDTAALLAGFARMKPEVQAALKGWVAGYNRYLKDTGAANLPAPCKGQPWVRAVDEVDMLRHLNWAALQASGGVGTFVGALYLTTPPAASAVSEKSTGEWDGNWDNDFWRSYRADRERLGSNALALGSEATDNGRGMLLGTPHLPWLGTLRFYQFHVTVPGQMDAMGAALFGFPFPNIGFNKDVAWSHTNDTASHFALYQLKLDPTNPLRYTYDGQTRDMTAKTVTVQVPAGPGGALVPVSKTFYSSVHGVVISLAPPLVWSKTNAYAIGDANLLNWRLGDQWFDINRAASTIEVEAALERNLGVPWNNTIAADRNGSAFYGDISPVLNIDRFQQSICTPDVTMAGVFALNGFPVLDGSRSTCLPVVDASAPQSGLMPGSRMPRLHTQSFAHNSNDSYWLTNPAYDLYSFYIPAIVGAVPAEQNLRTRLGVSQAMARLSGTDGLGGTKFTLAQLQQISLSNRVYSADLFLPDLLTLCGTAAADSVKSLCDVLGAWDRKAELTSRGAHLWREFFTAARSIPNVYKVPFNYLAPLATPNGLNITNPTVATALVNALAAAGKKITDAGLTVDAPLGTVQFGIQALLSGGKTIVPVHGGVGTALGIYNAIGSTLQPGVGYIVTDGTSYIQTVQFADNGVNAQAFLTYSQSSNPASPHFADQTARFSAKQWITLPFTESAITSDPAYRTSTISE